MSLRVRLATSEPSRVLGFIDQTIYANEDSPQGLVWANREVLELLRSIRLMLVEDSKPSSHGYATDCPQWRCPHISTEDRRDGEACSACPPCNCASQDSGLQSPE